MTALLQTSLSQSSVRTYNRHWNNFQEFIWETLHTNLYLPVTAMILGKYISHLCLAGYSYATILTVVSVISFAHKLRGIKDPAASFLITKLLTGVRNKIGRFDGRKPITLTLLRKMMVYIELLWGDSYNALLVKAIFCLMFTFALRVGEVVKSTTATHTMQLDNVRWIFTRKRVVGMKVKLPSYKASKGRTTTLKIMADKGNATCPVQALMKYVAARGSQPGFLFQQDNGKVVTRRWLVTQLEKLMSALGLDTKSYNSHSFRIGACTHWANLGDSITTIKLKGRWRSFAFTKYLRPDEIKF